MADYFIQYLKQHNYPDTFVMTNNGYSWAWYWTCPEGLNMCRPSADSQDVKFCEMKSKKKMIKNNINFMLRGVLLLGAPDLSSFNLNLSAF